MLCGTFATNKGKRRIGMKVLRWGVCALAALLMTAGSSFANDSEIEAMKAAMDNMKQEMDAMRSTMSAEREAMRESAGGAPEALRSNGGNATVRIGGAVIVRYDMDISSNDNDQGTGDMYTGGEYVTQNGWKMDTAKIDFNVQINEDLSAYIDIRPSKFDKAYFQWNNIGGSGLGAQVGYIGIPGGMYSASWSPTNSVLIQNPVTKSVNDLLNLASNAADSQFDSGISNNDDLTEMGVKLYYEMDQFKITATVFNNGALGSGTGMGGLSGTNAADSKGSWRNAGFNHTVMLEYNPAFLEGLHFSATYSGVVDAGEGTYGAVGRGSSYSPEFDLGVAYVGDKFSAWVTGDMAFNPLMFGNTWVYGLSAGANYNITEKFAVGVGLDWAQLVSSNGTIQTSAGMPGGVDSYDYEAMGGRIQVGAKYTLCNGIWFRANYAHTFFGWNVEDRSQVRGRDKIVFETGVSF